MKQKSVKSEDRALYILLLAIINIAALFVPGCDRSGRAVLKEAYSPSKDKDVTASSEYNFSAFTNTVWKTKTKTAVANLKRYTGAQEIKLLAPHRFDPENPRYSPVPEMGMVVILPPGTHLRVTRLMQDQGAWGGVQVEAIIEDGTNAQKAVYLDDFLLAYNRWNGGEWSITNWDVNPDLLEK